jgi:hypothetical protein
VAMTFNDGIDHKLAVGSKSYALFGSFVTKFVGIMLL